MSYQLIDRFGNGEDYDGVDVTAIRAVLGQLDHADAEHLAAARGDQAQIEALPWRARKPGSG
jgi:hypothetical protein